MINLRKNSDPITAREIVIERLVNYYRTANCDRYGQLAVIVMDSIAKNDEEKAELRTIVQTASYGGSCGTFYGGFVPWGAFKDSEIESLCQNAFVQNPSRQKMNNW